MTDFPQRKQEVLEVYESFQQLFHSVVSTAESAGVGKDTQAKDFRNKFKTLMSDIERKAESVRADRFVLMVAGEAKSGKSTFINAYLGVELLPMDVKQCTSSIVEIKYGECFRLKATYADGKTQEIREENAVRDFLRRNAALDDEYRDIPVPTINYEILVKLGQRAQKKGVKITIPKKMVDDMLQDPSVIAANIHNIPDYNDKIRDYIRRRAGDWRKIVVKMEIFFPFEDDLKGIQIIDSPGVCARGGVSDITSGYIERANAIMFLKPIVGQALESAQFDEFMRNVSVERNHNALFLVLTRATGETPANIKRLEEEARKQFASLSKRNLLVVDSKAELYAHEFENVEDIQERLWKIEEEGQLDHFANATWNSVDVKHDREKFLRKLREQSGFEKVHQSLALFGRTAHYIALGELLDAMARVYTKIIADMDQFIRMYQLKAQDPAELTKRIDNIKLELDVLNRKMHAGVNEIMDGYTGENGKIDCTVQKAKQEFVKKMKPIDPESAEAFEALKKYSLQKINEYAEIQNHLQKKIVEECDEALAALSDKSSIAFESLKPDFSEDTFQKIKDSTKEKANETRSYKEGLTFKKTRSYPEYSQKKHFSMIKKSIITRLDKISENLKDNLYAFTLNISSRYTEELKKNAEIKKQELDSIEKAKQSAEEIQTAIGKLSEIRDQCAGAKAKLVKLKGGIERHVQQTAGTQGGGNVYRVGASSV